MVRASISFIVAAILAAILLAVALRCWAIPYSHAATADESSIFYQTRVGSGVVSQRADLEGTPAEYVAQTRDRRASNRLPAYRSYALRVDRRVEFTGHSRRGPLIPLFCNAFYGAAKASCWRSYQAWATPWAQPYSNR